jgi:hypothetical protein
LERPCCRGAARDLSLVLDHPARNLTADQSDAETEQDLNGKLGSAARSHIDIGGAGPPRARIVHPHTFKTHRLVPSAQGLVLTRILFD